MIHLTPQPESVISGGVWRGSAWVRYGDVKQLTMAQYQRGIAGPGSQAQLSAARTYAVKLTNPDNVGIFKPTTNLNAYRVQEYWNLEDVTPDATALISGKQG